MLLTCTAVGCGDAPAPAEQPEPDIRPTRSTLVQSGGLTLDKGRKGSAGLALNGIRLNGIHLNGIHLNGIHLNGIHLNGIHLNGIHLNGIHLNGLDMNGIHLNGIHLNGVDMNGIHLNGLDLSEVNLNGIALNGFNLNEISLNALRLNGINLNGVDLSAINVDGLSLDGVRLNGLLLDGLKLDGINLAGVPLDTEQLDNFKLALSYVAKCALTSNQCVTINDVDSSTFQLCGEHGLDSTWDTDLETSVGREQAVTQCVVDAANNDSSHPNNLVTHANQERLVVRDFFNHVVSCALPAQTCVTVTDTDGVSTYQACGSEGLDPAWQFGPPTQGAVSELVAACVTEQATDHGDAWFDYRERFRAILQYSVQCALRGDQSVQVTDWDGSTLTWQGALGLADWWGTSALSPAPSPQPAAAGEELVSACLMARANAKGNSVMLSLRARPEMAPDSNEAMLYAQHEGAFMGNLFGTTPVAKSCAGPGGSNWLRDPQTGAPIAAGRVCAAGTDCGFDYVGSCATVCNVQPGGSETLYDECAGNAHVINTFLYSVEDFDADENARTTTAIESSGAPMVASADFDRDGYADLAIENNQASIIVKLANGEGGFGPNMTYNLGAGAGVKALIARDLDADGNVDLVTANAASLSVLLGDTKGTFSTPATLSVSGAAGSLASVATGDFDGDGKVDLATNLTSGVGVFLGNGDGTFGGQGSYGTSGSHRSLVAGDFDGDGKLDLASASASGASVYVFFGNGNGTFGNPTAVSVGTGSGLARALAAGDFNADGRTDLAAAVSGNNHVKVLLGQANGSFSAQSYSIAGSGDTTAVTAAYLDGDASLDLVVTRGNEAVVLSGDASGALTTAGTFAFAQSGSASSIAAGHLDLDPRWRTDLLVSTDAGDMVLVPGN